LALFYTREKSDCLWIVKPPHTNNGAGVNFINILRARFLCESAFLPKYFCQSQNLTREKLLNLPLHKQCARKTLMKLTTGVYVINDPQEIPNVPGC